MIDFPASPIVGQLFSAPNGVTYQWTGTAWITSGQTVAGGADFSATGVNGQAMGSGGTVIAFNTVTTGNAGGYYSTSTNRFTPPAGRYNLVVSAYFWNNSGSTGSYQLIIRKNGLSIGPGATQTCAQGDARAVTVDVTADANGTDYFDVAGYGASGTPQLYSPYFMAFPISGMKGPPGDVGSAATGDFMASNSANLVGGVNAWLTVIFNTVITGNSGNWYNTTTGRYTPPAGRYFMSGTMGQGYSPVGAVIAYTQLLKNGVRVAFGGQVPGATNWTSDSTASGVFDANGTDYFEVQTQFNQANNVIAAGCANFYAFPTAGLRGPQGAAGPVGAGGDLPTGSVIDYAGTTPPAGWLICNGAEYATATYPALFTAIGYNFGQGSGSNFKVPDLQGRVTAGKEAGGGVRLTQAISGVNGGLLGAVGGDQRMTSHNHGARGQGSVGNNLYNGTDRACGTADGTAAGFFQSVNVQVDPSGGGASQNVQPTMIMNKIIKT